MVMASARANGAASNGAVMDLGSTTPETFKVRIDGEIMTAYITTNRRYPGTIAAELDDARNEWQAARVPDDTDEPTPGLLTAVHDLLDGLEEGWDNEHAKVTNSSVRALRMALEQYEQPRFKPNWPAWEHYLVRSAVALIPGLTYEQADNMDKDLRLQMLMRTGYIGFGNVATEGDEQNPPVEPLPSTGERAAPDSPASTT